MIACASLAFVSAGAGILFALGVLALAGRAK